MKLSKCEEEVMELVARGFSNQEIASILYKSYGTIKNQNWSIFNKLGARNRTEAVLLWQDNKEGN
jgi:DNA-binding NarL/FixJ family response regulator